MVGVLEEVVTGALADVVSVTGQWLGAALINSRGRGYRDMVELIRWFDTYQLTDSNLELTGLPEGVAPELLAGALQRDEFHSVLHELLAVRLTGAPESDARSVRAGLHLTLATMLPVAGTLADALFEYYDGQICGLVGRLAGANPGLLEKVRQEALAVRTIAVLRAVERHTAALAGQQNPQADAEFTARYRGHVADYHGKLEPPDFERRRRVPIIDLYVGPRIVQLSDANGEQLRVMGLPDLAAELDRSVLLGHPGGGKTSAAHVLMDHFCQASSGRVPFMVTLRDFASEDPPARSVIGHIEHRLETFYQCKQPHGWTERALLGGAAVVIFDGLDELLDTTRRAEVTSIIEQFAAEYPLARILVTSRLVGYDEARLDDHQFIRYCLDGFDADQAAEYVVRWFALEQGLTPGEGQRWAEAFMAESEAVADLRSNPLMLALMCILYRGVGSLPRSRPEVYEQCSTLLFRRWDARRRIHVELRARHLVEPALRHLAYWLFTSSPPDTAATEGELVRETTRFLHVRGFEDEADAADAAREFVYFCRGRAWVFSDAGTTADGQPLYAFTHRTFMEYFAAAYLSAACDSPEELGRRLSPHIARQEWHVVADLTVQIKDRASDRGAARIITTILNGRHRSVRSRSHILEFLAHSLRFVDPPPHVVRELSRNVLDHAFGADPDDELRYQPLHHLITACLSSRDIVRDEIASKAALLVASAEPDHQAHGLRLAIWTDDLNIPLQNSRVGSWDSELWKFWSDFAAASTTTYAKTILSAAAQNPTIKYAALSKHLITTGQILASEQPDLRTLFTSDLKFFGIAGPPYLLRQVWGLIRGRPGHLGSDPMPDMQAFGRFAAQHPHPPLVTGPTAYGGWLADLDDSKAPSSLRDALTYLGAVLLFAIGLETDDQIPHTPTEYQLGPLSDLNPYIVRRLRLANNTTLPDLPLPSPYAELLKAWANREVNFAVSAPE